jgi:EAL and modified HD-GYP domain-containing signal transduction protein
VLRYLGENQLRRFVAVVVLASAGNDTVNELYPLSMMRGKFCELMAEKMNEPTLAENAFMCGLFSLLDTILELPMAELMKQIGAAECEQCAVPSGRAVSRHVRFAVTMNSRVGRGDRNCHALGLSDEDVVEAMRWRRSGRGECGQLILPHAAVRREEERDTVSGPLLTSGNTLRRGGWRRRHRSAIHLC